MSNINIDLLVQDKSWKSQKEINKKLMEEIFIMVLDNLKISLCENEIEISINLNNDKNIKDLNNKYRNKDKTTNVLTFSLYENKKDVIRDLKKLPYICIGDIIFSYDTIKNEAEEQNKSFKNHFIHMLVHSYLHLFCYDHLTKKDETIMENLEIEILKKMDINNPYLID